MVVDASAGFGLAGAAVVGVTALGAAGMLANAALGPASQLFGRTLIAGSNPNDVFLTYDDGPNEPTTARLLDILHRADASAAFFCIGRFARLRPDLVRTIHAAGHIVGNHTDTHPWLLTQSRRRIREELRACNETLEDTLGQPVRFFRPPHGARRPAVLQAAQELGLATVQWNVMGRDWKPIGVEGVLCNVDRGLRRAARADQGANVLLHDGWDVQFGADRSTTVDVTAILVERFRAEGRRIATLDQLSSEP